MLNFPGYDVSESRRLFNGELHPASVSASGQGSTHRSPGYLQGFADACYDPTASHACPPGAAGYGQSLAGYPVSAPTYGSYRLPFSAAVSQAVSNAAAVYEEHRKFNCYSKPDLNCSANISAHGNRTRSYP